MTDKSCFRIYDKLFWSDYLSQRKGRGESNKWYNYIETLTPFLPLSSTEVSNMAKWLTVAELSSELGISERAVRKQIEEGKWTAKKRGNKWLINTEDITDSDTSKMHELRAEVEKLQAVLLERENLVEQVKTENKHLQTRLDEALQDARMKSERSDMIIMKLTTQLEQHQLMIEDMRQRQPIWQKLKARLGFQTARTAGTVG